MSFRNHERAIDLQFPQKVTEQQVTLIHAGIPRIDACVGGFKSSLITLLDSNHPFSFELLSILCVRAIKAFGKTVIYVDGWNSIDPYLIGSLSKRLGLRADEVLPKIMVARAFTAYQLDSIISDRLEDVILDHGPSFMIISCITDLLMDRTVREQEAVTILRRSLSIIEKLTSDRNLITIVTKRTRPLSARSAALDEILYKGAGEIVTMRRTKEGVELYQSTRACSMHYVPLSIHQTTLEEFIGGVSIG